MKRQFKNSTYTPTRNKKYQKRDNYESLLRRLFFECNGVKYLGELNYLSDEELLGMINKLIIRLDCVPMTDFELQQELSLKN
jgi:predicted ATP-grasp superfamily ATP-dependent carboligase